MKILLLAALGHTRAIRGSLLALVLIVATAAYAGVPSMNITVSDASGKVAFKGATNGDATFATSNLAPGSYVVQFHSKSEALKGNQYLLVIAAGKKKVIADAVPGEKFHGGGVAMRVNVQPGLKITGQVANEQAVVSTGTSKVKMMGGKRYVWVTAQTGSNLGNHWEEEGLATARNVGTMGFDKMRRMQDASFEGSMLNRYTAGGGYAVWHGY